MWAVALALAGLLWMWAAAALHGARWLERSGNYSVRMAYFAVMAAIGATAILLLPWMLLPTSLLSQGWTLRQLQNTQQLSALLALLVFVAALWRAHLQLKPVSLFASAPPSSAPPAPAKAGQKKRRP